MNQTPLTPNTDSSLSLSENEQQFLDRSLPTAQFEQLIEAILEGKYSWACVLILKFSGYNPLHYIPYRTYNRICKDNMPKPAKGKISHKSTEQAINAIEPKPNSAKRLDDVIQPDRYGMNWDLAYVDRLSSRTMQQVQGARGGWASYRD